MNKILEISQSTYDRLGELAQPFETPEEVIKQLIECYKPKEASISTKTKSSNSMNTVNTYHKLSINFTPDDPLQFKKLLLQQKPCG